MRVVSALVPIVQCSYHQNLTESRRVDTDASQSGSTQSTSVQWPLYSVLCTVHTSLPPSLFYHQLAHLYVASASQYIWGIKLENISYNIIICLGVASLKTLHSTEVLGRLLQNMLQMEVNDQDTRLVSHPPLINVHLTMQARSAENINKALANQRPLFRQLANQRPGNLLHWWSLESV